MMVSNQKSILVGSEVKLNFPWMGLYLFTRLLKANRNYRYFIDAFSLDSIARFFV